MCQANNLVVMAKGKEMNEDHQRVNQVAEVPVLAFRPGNTRQDEEDQGIPQGRRLVIRRILSLDQVERRNEFRTNKEMIHHQETTLWALEL